MVLGCTHYALITEVLSQLWGSQVALLEAGQPVARRTRQVLQAAGLLRPAIDAAQQDLAATPLLCLSTGNPKLLDQALQDWHIGGPTLRASAMLLP